MTDATPSPETEIAASLDELGLQARRLIRSEAQAAEHEVWDKAKASAPVIGLLGGSGLCALISAACLYRFSMRMLERLLPPSLAALLAAGVSGTGSVVLLRAGMARLNTLRAPLPSETARATLDDARAAASPGEGPTPDA